MAGQPPLPANPKQIHGDRKTPLDLLPQLAMVHWAEAQREGAVKYGPFKWRENPVEARTYIAAARRHLMRFAAGSKTASDSRVHELGHVMACCAILIDAEANGCLTDNRIICQATLDALDHYESQRTPTEGQ